MKLLFKVVIFCKNLIEISIFYFFYNNCRIEISADRFIRVPIFIINEFITYLKYKYK